jgi:MoaA/NifB/PqqE/SkfB family radical SAM enzyme
MNAELTTPVLASEWKLLIENNRAYIERRQDRVKVAALSSGEAVTIGLLDGTRTSKEVEVLLGTALQDAGQRLFRTVVGRLQPLLRNGPARKADISLKRLAGVTAPEPSQGFRLLPGPKVLHWHVTRYCPRQCVYCYAEPQRGNIALDSTLPRKRLAEIFDEAASLGAKNLLASGAEPLLRKDLPEVAGDAICAGLNVFLTTKHPISPSIALRLAKAGLPHISLSLDTTNKSENARLIGNGKYADQVLASAKNLTSAGVAFSVQCVITRQNPFSARDVAAFAARSGARVLQLVPYFPVRKPIGPWQNQDLQLEDEAYIDGLVAELAQRHSKLGVERFQELSAETAGFTCDIGQTKLFFLPDGTVHRCYKLVFDNSLRGLDLNQCSVAEAWHAREFYKVLSPSHDQYSGTACSGCARFSSCHDEGRCIFKALTAYGRYAAPDRSCPNSLRTSRLSGHLNRTAEEVQ